MSIKLNFNIDAGAIAEQFNSFKLEVEQDLNKAVANLAAITDAKVKEMASQELHTSRKDFMDSLGFEEVAPGVWVISVDESGLWVEEGIDANKDMKPGLLAENFKTSKEGHRYKAIPFDYGSPPSQQTPSTQVIVSYLKQQLKKEGVPFRKIERNTDGSPKVGKLHEFDFGNPRGTRGGPGKGNTPVLKNLSIYQSVTKTGNVRRDILTFRTVSSGPGSQGKWHHPGLEAKKFLDRALDWAMKEWEEKILPEVMEKWK
ncbi:MAG: hypothetical protein HC840_00250 [Leptolyngbyaceae cyanobacterium RM2_2_4]|nr:hypothetical protein [Leptolyngbyaceae cyanobacterium RM2_2_4]